MCGRWGVGGVIDGGWMVGGECKDYFHLILFSSFLYVKP